MAITFRNKSHYCKFRNSNWLGMLVYHEYQVLESESTVQTVNTIWYNSLKWTEKLSLVMQHT